MILDFSKEKGLETFTCNSKVLGFHNESTIEDKVQFPVEHWLDGFNQAEYVITDSFHACVFSILFKKQFFVYGNEERGMARYNSLFKMLGIEDRYVQNIHDVNRKRDIDYDIVFENLSNLRNSSLTFLDRFFSGSRYVRC